jgi:hypothetical protein
MTSTQGCAGHDQDSVRILSGPDHSLTDQAKTVSESAMKAATSAFAPKSGLALRRVSRGSER